MEKIRFAIVGCGRIARRHATQIAQKGILTAVCDIIAERADQLGKDFAVPAYYSLDAMLAKEKGNTHVIVICTPNGLHASHSISSLQQGFHVLCEKPMALTVVDCEAMMAAAATANRQLFIVKQNRFNPPVSALKKVLDEGRLGKLYSLQLNCFWNRTAEYYHNSWKGTKDMDGGTLFTQFSHFIDLLCWIAGDVKEVKAFTANYAHQGTIEFEDTGMALLQFVNGAIGSVHYTVNSYKKNMEGSLTVFAEKGTVKIGGQYLNELEYQQIENYHIGNLPAGNTANDYGSYQGSMSNHDKVYDNLVNTLQHNQPFIANPLDGLKTVQVIEKIYSKAVNL